jgi:hypothetical protein
LYRKFRGKVEWERGGARCSDSKSSISGRATGEQDRNAIDDRKAALTAAAADKSISEIRFEYEGLSADGAGEVLEHLP